MLTYCKTCNEPTDVKLDKGTMKPICTVCGNVVDATIFHINAMKGNNDYLKPKGQSFMFYCDTCKTNVAGALNEKDQCACPRCKKVLNITSTMLKVMIERKKEDAKEPTGE